MSKLYYITSPHDPNKLGIIGNCVQFWRVNRKGYTCNLDEAGKYPEEEALSIYMGKRGDRIYPVEMLDAIAVRHVNFQRLPK